MSIITFILGNVDLVLDVGRHVTLTVLNSETSLTKNATYCQLSLCVLVRVKLPMKEVFSAMSGCPVMLRLHRTEDHGWIVVEHRSEHNHELSETCGEKKQWPLHKHIDKYTKDLIRLLRENNVGLTKLYSILGNFFRSMNNVPTMKRTLKAVCQKITREQAEDDIKKTLLVFREFREEDPGFVYSVDTDDEGHIKSLMWTNSRSRMQYAHFEDVITFDTTQDKSL